MFQIKKKEKEKEPVEECEPHFSQYIFLGFFPFSSFIFGIFNHVFWVFPRFLSDEKMCLHPAMLVGEANSK